MYIPYSKCQATHAPFARMPQVPMDSINRIDDHTYSSYSRCSIITILVNDCRQSPLVHPFLPSPTQMTQVTNTSLGGWGAHLGKISVQGEWSAQKKPLHIHILELRAVKLEILAFKQSIKWRHILVQTDNTTTMFYVKKQGGTEGSVTYSEAQELWHLAIQKGISLTVSYFPDVDNAKQITSTDNSTWSTIGN